MRKLDARETGACKTHSTFRFLEQVNSKGEMVSSMHLVIKFALISVGQDLTETLTCSAEVRQKSNYYLVSECSVENLQQILEFRYLIQYRCSVLSS